MSDELTIASRLAVDNVNLQESDQDGDQLIDQALAAGPVPGMVIATTTEAAISVVGLTTLGWAKFKNLDLTNYVTIGLVPIATYVPFARLKPGEHFTIRLEPGVTYYIKANTASCKVQCKIYND